MVDIVVAVAAKVAEYLVAPVGRQCGYVIFTNSYVGQLEKEREKLENARGRVQHLIDEDLKNMKLIEADVEKWVTDVETIANKARDVRENDGRAKKTCFYGWLPNPKIRYRLGREARTTVQTIRKLIQEGRFERVSYERAPPGLVGGAPNENSSACDGGDTIQELIARGQSENPPPGRAGDDGGDTIQELIAPGQFEKVELENCPPGLVGDASDVNLSVVDGGDTITDSRASIFQGIMKALDDKKLKVVGVYGPGGVGKTTLLKEVMKKLKKEGRPFHMIVKAEVSQTPDLNNIQGQIADALSLNLKDKESQQGRRDLLFQRLQRDPNEKVLIILDDLWAELDLEAIGIPLGDESMGCKLLLTSRDRSVLEQKMHTKPTFHLEGLKEDEAFRLFEYWVGNKLEYNEELKAKAAQVVRKLAGLPLLITSVASTLKCSGVSAWDNALIKIEDRNNEKIVKWSYDHLQYEDAKCLFLLCGLIGGTIEVELLLGLGMGLGLFEGYYERVQYSRNRLNQMLDSLHSFCLLQDGGNDKKSVNIHDLYSEAVMSTPFGDQNSLMMNNNCVSWSKEKLEKYWAISLVNVDSDRLAKLMRCVFPNLKILMLSQPENWRGRPAHRHDGGDCCRLDFTYMKELQVLYVRSMHIATLPSSIDILENLQSLYLVHCEVDDVAILGKLKALQILSFAGSTISRLPEEIGKLTNLRSLNLSRCYSLKIIVPGALKSLINLEELHMKTFDQWMGKHEIQSESCGATLVELKNLTKLASLEISILRPIILLEDYDLSFENLDKFWIDIGKSGVSGYEGLTTMTLYLEGCDSILSRKWVQKILQKTQILYLSELSENEKSPRGLCSQEFREVKYLNIEDSPSIKYVADSSNGLPLTAFGKLEYISLKNLINLEKICHGPIALECFSQLKVVRVRQCDQLKYLWRLSDVQGLIQLEEIEVQKCDSMQSIVTYDVGEGIVSTNDRVELRNVRSLRLLELPNMKSFCSKAKIAPEGTSIQVSLPHLESLTMVGLLGLEEILCSERSLKYSNLRLLTIRESKSMSKSIMKLDWILKLPNLESMTIKISPSAEVIFDLEELEVIEDVKILSQLTTLTLHGLPNLQCVCKQDVKLQGISILQNLRDLSIYRTGLSFLFSVSVAKCFKKIRTISVSGCPNMKAVIVDEGRYEGTYDIIEFPQLEYLSIYKCRVEKFFSYPCGKKEPVTTTSDSQNANSDSFFDQKVTFPNITVLQIDGLQCKELWNDQIPTDSFQKLESLILENCDNLRRIAPPQMWKVLQHCLKNLEVISCHLIEIIYEGHGMDTEGGELRELLLRDLKNMKHIWHSEDLPNVPFPNLIDVKAVRCPHLEVLFTTFTVKFLGQIKELVVESCENMKLIAGHEKGEESTGRTVTMEEVLRLSMLPKFRRSFLPEKYSRDLPWSEDFPSLEVLSINSCGGGADLVLSDGMNLSAGDGGDFITPSRVYISEDIMNALDDEKVKVVGVYGPGGVGKTTLLEKVEKKLRKDGRPFRMIVKAEVSRTPDLNNIQGQIADALSLNLEEKESQQGRGDLLFRRLRRDPNKKVLIIMDDLWGALDLKAVGIPSGDKSMNCKLLLTSRDKRVLEQRMHADETFRLTSLEEDEAFKLFEKIVGNKLRDDEELKVKAAQVVTKLAGLPLLINSVASTLKCSDVSTWEDMLMKIEDPHTERIVKWSYDHLKSEEAKCLFLLCGLIGGTIEVELLLGLGIGLGLFGGFANKMQSSRNILNTMLNSLHSFCLLQDGGDGKENVTIHDLYSGVVVSHAFRGENSLMMNNNYGPRSKEKLEKCWAICLADVDKDRLDKLMTCRFPGLKILMLSQPEGWRWRQHDHEVGDCWGLPDFTNMKELCALYLRSMYIARLPPSIVILGNLHSLYLDHCNVEDVAILGELKTLQILSFAWSTISRLPEEIGKLTNLRLLNLKHCYSLKIIVHGALKGLVNLEELHMKESLCQWMGKHEKLSESCVAELAELKSLTKLASLEISIPDPIILLEDGDLPFENLEKFWINIGPAKEMEYEGLTTMNLNLLGCDSILSKKGVEKNLQKTQHLYLSNLSEFKESPCELCTQGFREVKYLDIKDSPSIKYIADSSNGLPRIAFGKLESFFLQNLINLEKICHGPIASGCFNKLKAVRVGQCGKLKYLWCLSDVQRLVQLEEIKVWECNSMQSIVAHDAGEDIVSANNRVELRNVRSLELSELPNMTSFCTKAEITSKDTPIQVSLPHSESPKMVELVGPKEILCSECSSTSKSIMKLDWTLKLPNLESLVILSSPLVEVVFDLEGLEVTEDVEILSQLTWLTLHHLPDLQCVCKQDVKLQGISILRNLRDLYIYKTGLSFLFSVSVAKCFKEIRTIIVLSCPNMKAVIVDEGRNEGTYDIIEFPLLEYLSIRHCPVEKFFSYPCGKKEPVTTTSDSQDANSDSFFDRKVTFPNITVLQIDGLQCKELWNDQIPTDSFQKLESLILENCDNLRRIAPPQMWKVLQHCLKNLEVISCHLIEIIYEGHGMDIEGGELRELLLRDLKNMKHIWQSKGLPNVPFPNLINVEAMRCPHLEVLFTTFTAKFLGQIKELVVESCEDMKLIAGPKLVVESCEDIKLIAGHEEREETTGTTVTFSKLTVLRLFKLPNFSGFLPGNYPLTFIDSDDYFPSLKVYSIESCGAWNRFCGDWKGYKEERESREFFKFRDWRFQGLRGSSSHPHSPSSYSPFTNSTWLDEKRRARMWSFSDSD